jgi:CRISPR-associated protein Cmr3
MNTILLQPTDVLFFRDGRPMTGSLAGHGAAWPLPNVINAAFHAALHRGFPVEHGLLKGVSATQHGDHVHKIVRVNKDGRRETHDDGRHRRFGSLVTAGPFPVNGEHRWFFPRPADLQDATLRPALLPARSPGCANANSLPKPLRYAAANRLPPTKESAVKGWLSREAFAAYLRNDDDFGLDGHALNDAEFCDQEHAIGIEIDPATGTTGRGEATGKIYSAHYLRLRDREQWRLGLLADCRKAEDARLLDNLLTDNACIVVGGQQRICTARCVPESPAQCLPTGLKLDADFRLSKGKALVKWVLLSPAIWPEMTDGPSHRGTKRVSHCGGWLPNWVDPQTGALLLRSVAQEERKRRRSINASGEGYCSEDGADAISANLVAAIIPKPLVVTGWALPDEAAGEQGGAQSTHLAVPAGAVYYFEAGSADDARKLAAALNWHGSESNPTTVRNRRSTLLGEKGFGLGVCGTWQFYKDVPGRSGQ